MSKDNIQQAPFDFFEKGYSHGLQYLIVQHPHSGHLCGYVRLPRTSQLYKVANKKKLGYKYGKAISKKKTTVRRGYDARDIEGLRVHGDITFAGTKPHKFARGYWIGFDCAHAGDLCPAPSRSDEFSVFRTPEFVRQQLALLAAQVRMHGTPALPATLTLWGE